jgi:hypothetical protein
MARNSQLPQFREGPMPGHLAQMMGNPAMPPEALAEAHAMAEAFERGLEGPGGPPGAFMDHMAHGGAFENPAFHGGDWADEFGHHHPGDMWAHEMAAAGGMARGMGPRGMRMGPGMMPGPMSMMHMMAAGPKGARARHHPAGADLRLDGPRGAAARAEAEAAGGLEEAYAEAELSERMARVGFEQARPPHPGPADRLGNGSA